MHQDIKPLLDLACATVGLAIMNKTPAEIKQTLGIEGELSPEVTRQLREGIYIKYMHRFESLRCSSVA
jgi:Skp1 family, dimerisation domain